MLEAVAEFIKILTIILLWKLNRKNKFLELVYFPGINDYF